MLDETFADDLSTLNQNLSSSSIVYRTLNVHYVSQEYIIRSNVALQSLARPIEELSAQTIISEPLDRQESILHEADQPVQPLRNLLDLTPRNVAIVELITSEQRFVHDMENILKVT